MLFIDLNFLLFFLPLCLIIFYLIPTNISKLLVLISFSIIFYASNKFWFLYLLLASILVNFFTSIFISKSNTISKKSFLFFGIFFNLTILFYYKYYMVIKSTFFDSNQNLETSLIIPLGISFYTFQQIIFLIDIFKDKKTEIDFLSTSISLPKKFLRYCVFVCFFPQLVIGPIVYLKEFLPQIKNKKIGKFDISNLEIGITLIIIGLFKKVIIADNISILVGHGFNENLFSPSKDSFLTLFSVIGFYLQLYFDFSGYSDIALGLARLFGIILPINFDSPLKSLGIIDFYKRWHITLTRIIIQYVYTPISLNLARFSLEKGWNKGFIFKIFSSWLPILINFFAIALWHGAYSTFILFGFFHGVWYIIETELKNIKIIKKEFKGFNLIVISLKRVIFFILMSVSFSLFNSSSIEHFQNIMTSLFNIKNLLLSFFEILNFNFNLLTFNPKELIYLVIGLFIVFCFPNSNEFLRKHNPGILTWENRKYNLISFTWKRNWYYGITFSLIFLLFIYYSGKISPFLYQGF